jgi:Ohr subfamily peroxiredoxin
MSNTSKLGPELTALLERGEISPEAYAEYAAAADIGSTATAGDAAGAGTGPTHPKEVLYTAEAVVEGGRAGHGRTSDGRLEVDLSVPAAMSGDDGPGTNPEQLFAVGFAACFQSALLGVARGRKLDATGSRMTSHVGIGPLDSGGFGIQVSLDLHAPNITAEDAHDLMLRAETRCPYSNATRGNIIVALSVDGVPVERVS